MGSASARLTLAGKAVRARGARAVNLQQRRQAAATRALGHALTLPSTDNALPESRVRDRYRVGELILDQGAVPVIWWSQTPNLGDLLSPWLIGRMTGRPVVYAGRGHANYVAIGSVINLATPHSTVWGAGSFGTERRSSFARHASYRAVRGPLTRSRLLNLGLDCPAVYGDPALLVPHYFAPEVAQTHEVGIVIRHTESRWRHSELGEGVRLIDFGSGDVEQVPARHPELSADRLLVAARPGAGRRLRHTQRLAQLSIGARREPAERRRLQVLRLLHLRQQASTSARPCAAGPAPRSVSVARGAGFCRGIH